MTHHYECRNESTDDNPHWNLDVWASAPVPCLSPPLDAGVSVGFALFFHRIDVIIMNAHDARYNPNTVALTSINACTFIHTLQNNLDFLLPFSLSKRNRESERARARERERAREAVLLARSIIRHKYVQRGIQRCADVHARLLR